MAAKRTKLPASVRLLIATALVVLEVWSFSDLPGAGYINLAAGVFLAVLLVRYWIGVHRRQRQKWEEMCRGFPVIEKRLP